VLAVYEAVKAGKVGEALTHEARLRAVQDAFGSGSAQAAYKAAMASSGVGEPWLVPPRLPLTELETSQLVERLTALEVL
jgi:dihydrodipicolinate synthase/N-acetylneuraminate lyase